MDWQGRCRGKKLKNQRIRIKNEGTKYKKKQNLDKPQGCVYGDSCLLPLEAGTK